MMNMLFLPFNQFNYPCTTASTVGPLSVTPTTTTSMAMFTTASDSMTNTPITTSTELGGGGGNWNCHGIKSDDKVFSTS